MKAFLTVMGMAAGVLYGFLGMAYARDFLLRLFVPGYDPGWDLAAGYFLLASGIAGAIIGGVLGYGAASGWFSPISRQRGRLIVGGIVFVAVPLGIHLFPVLWQG
jgi:hypothetical protein